MALSRALYRTCNAFFPFSDFIYILQLEEYSSRRFLKWMPRFFFRRNLQIRQHVEWRARATIVCAGALILWLLGLALIWWLLPSLLIALWFLFAIPICVLGTNSALTIPFSLAHTRLRQKAAKNAAEFQKRGKIIVIAGSFGKTTTKHFLEQLARYNFRVQMTPGNVNTPAGIAAWLLEGVKSGTDLLIIEADGYSKREYQETGEMVHADIVVLTNVGDQHLERFGTRERLADAIAEVVASARKDAIVVCTQETRDALRKNVFENRSLHILTPDSEGGLSASNAVNLSLARETARILNIPEVIITDSASKLELPDRRQKPTTMYGYEAIDDSYNISWTTAQAGIAAAADAAKASGKKLLVITAGIMELNAENCDKNFRLGELLAKTADHTIVLRSMFAPEVVRGIGTHPHTIAPSLTTFLQDAHAQFNPREWFLLVQPEMHDLYY